MRFTSQFGELRPSRQIFQKPAYQEPFNSHARPKVAHGWAPATHATGRPPADLIDCRRALESNGEATVLGTADSVALQQRVGNASLTGQESLHGSHMLIHRRDS